MNGHEKQFSWFDMLDAIDFGRKDSTSHILKNTDLADGNKFIKQIVDKRKEVKLKSA